MSWIVESEDHSMIQDQDRSEDTTFTEGKLYGPLHKAGHALGFAMNVFYSQIVSHRHHMIKVNGWSRTKTRIVLAMSGAFLHQCENLVKFLRVMYDVLELHRHAVNQEVLHRDLSQANILINARHVSGRMKKLYDGKDRPRFCREVLDKIDHAEPEALVIDFDNACKYIDGEQRTHNPLYERTGTPKYIARSVSLGQILHKNHAFEPMPELPDDLAQRYAEVYNDVADPLRTFKDAEGNTHDGKLDDVTFKRYMKNRDVLKTEFQHCPRHDAESVFWCILAFLMRALPADGSKPEDDLNRPAFIKQWKKFEIHEIPEKDDNTDSRVSLIEDLEWSKVVHHKLALVSDLITELVEQVYPEYALLRPPPHKFHLHEAMQRILLKYVVQWKDQNIDFTTEAPRKIPISENMATACPTPDGQRPTISGMPTQTASKRDAGTAELSERPNYTLSKQERAQKPGEDDVEEVQDDDPKRICRRLE